MVLIQHYRDETIDDDNFLKALMINKHRYMQYACCKCTALTIQFNTEMLTCLLNKAYIS